MSGTQYYSLSKFDCSRCKNSYSTAQKLNRHVKEVHQKIREFYCVYCPKRFTRKEHLERHQLLHHTFDSLQQMLPHLDSNKKNENEESIESMSLLKKINYFLPAIECKECFTKLKSIISGNIGHICDERDKTEEKAPKKYINLLTKSKVKKELGEIISDNEFRKPGKSDNFEDSLAKKAQNIENMNESSSLAQMKEYHQQLIANLISYSQSNGLPIGNPHDSMFYHRFSVMLNINLSSFDLLKNSTT